MAHNSLVDGPILPPINLTNIGRAPERRSDEDEADKLFEAFVGDEDSRGPYQFTRQRLAEFIKFIRGAALPSPDSDIDLRMLAEQQLTNQILKDMHEQQSITNTHLQGTLQHLVNR